MAATLKPFAGTPFDFAVQTDSEPIALMEQIAAALKSAGWIRKKWSGGGSDMVFNPPGGEPQAGIISSQGIDIQIAESRLPDFGTAAGKLYLALKAADLAIRVQAIPDAKGVKPDAIHILIGTKP